MTIIQMRAKCGGMRPDLAASKPETTDKMRRRVGLVSDRLRVLNVHTNADRIELGLRIESSHPN